MLYHRIWRASALDCSVWCIVYSTTTQYRVCVCTARLPLWLKRVCVCVIPRSLAHRYETILIHYKAQQGMYKGGLFQFLFRLPKGYPIEAPLCHCLTPIWHPNILHDPEAEPREQNVCCSYLHDASFADKSEEGYVPGMSLWKVVWAICLLLHRFDQEGLGIFTLSNPLNKEAASQFLNDEEGFMEKARAYTAKYATEEYHRAELKRWHGFYPAADVVLNEASLGRASSIDKRLPETTLQATATGLQLFPTPLGSPHMPGIYGFLDL